MDILHLGINLTDILKSAIYASINGIAIFLSVRYMGRMMDKLDSRRSKGAEKDDRKETPRA